MAYLVLARKYRPQTFEEVVGQDHVTRTLQNAISADRVAHAILFSGPRGTGKTTVARILAKAMNCESGPASIPCNTCNACLDITAGSGVDVFEIDGASNNSVDQVRELRDNSRYMPAHSRFKIYIIDEVHMLSIAAFNALLKTLEEPPPHVMFFFATTEAHKIPITILSRCQRHDLKRIDHSSIVKQMETLCRLEAASVSTGILWAIARESGGSMRDALSLLDHILASTDSQMNDDDVMNLLGGMNHQVFFDISEAVFAGDISRILSAIETVFNSGQDLKRFYTDLLMHFRHVMLVKMDVRPEMVADLPASDIESLSRQVQGVSTAYIDQVFTLLFNAESSVRFAPQPRLAIEMVFFKIHQITPAVPIDLLIDRLDRLLQDPNPNKVSNPEQTAGVVETQSSYGKPATTPPAHPTSPAIAVDGSRDASESPGNQQRAEPRGVESDESESSDVPWNRMIAIIGKTKPSIAAALSRSQLVSASKKEFNVVVRDNDYTVNLIKKNLATIEAVCREHAGREIRFDFSNHESGQKNLPSAKQKADDLKRQLINHPLVADAVDIFSGKIEEIKIR